MFRGYRRSLAALQRVQWAHKGGPSARPVTPVAVTESHSQLQSQFCPQSPEPLWRADAELRQRLRPLCSGSLPLVPAPASWHSHSVSHKSPHAPTPANRHPHSASHKSLQSLGCTHPGIPFMTAPVTTHHSLTAQLAATLPQPDVTVRPLSAALLQRWHSSRAGGSGSNSERGPRQGQGQQQPRQEGPPGSAPGTPGGVPGEEEDEVGWMQALNLDSELDTEKEEEAAFKRVTDQRYEDELEEDELESLLLMRDVRGLPSLPPLQELLTDPTGEEEATAARRGLEKAKQEAQQMLRVRQVDDLGRAYGTGRRKCSIARVWIGPGSGDLTVNGRLLDQHFNSFEHRAHILQPFLETNTLGTFDVMATVKGGGLSGQAGALRLGISRALQNFEPTLRPSLKEHGFLRRDPRSVERKKPGKAKARKSFQWVKR